MTATAQPTQANAGIEWFRSWPMVLAGMVGVSFISTAPGTLGPFMEPLQGEFGWSRTQTSAGMTIPAAARIGIAGDAVARGARVGYCMGASLQLTTYLTSRYTGLRYFGTIFGLMSMLLAFGGGLGPIVAGAVFDSTGSYSLMMAGGVVIGVIAGLSVIGLGRYPDFSTIDESRPQSSGSASIAPDTVPQQQSAKNRANKGV